MDYAAHRKRELIEAMESCRAFSDDLNDAQFAELAAALGVDDVLRARFERLQRADAAIKAAFADVPVPADLAERVLRRLSETTIQPVDLITTTLEHAQEPPALLPLAAVAARQKFVSRRRVLAGFAVIAASAAVASAIWLHSHHAPSLTPGQVIETAMDFFARDKASPGERVGSVAPPGDFPISADIARFTDVRWRRVERFAEGDAVAYDLPSRSGKATLYVSKCTVAGLPPYPPAQPALSTGGNSAAAWQSGGLLYVLVVQGDAQNYADYLDRAQGPLT